MSSSQTDINKQDIINLKQETAQLQNDVADVKGNTITPSEMPSKTVLDSTDTLLIVEKDGSGKSVNVNEITTSLTGDIVVTSPTDKSTQNRTFAVKLYITNFLEHKIKTTYKSIGIYGTTSGDYSAGTISTNLAGEPKTSAGATDTITFSNMPPSTTIYVKVGYQDSKGTRKLSAELTYNINNVSQAILLPTVSLPSNQVETETPTFTISNFAVNTGADTQTGEQLKVFKKVDDSEVYDSGMYTSGYGSHTIASGKLVKNTDYYAKAIQRGATLGSTSFATAPKYEFRTKEFNLNIAKWKSGGTVYTGYIGYVSHSQQYMQIRFYKDELVLIYVDKNNTSRIVVYYRKGGTVSRVFISVNNAYTLLRGVWMPFNQYFYRGVLYTLGTGISNPITSAFYIVPSFSKPYIFANWNDSGTDKCAVYKYNKATSSYSKEKDLPTGHVVYYHSVNRDSFSEGYMVELDTNNIPTIQTTNWIGQLGGQSSSGNYRVIVYNTTTKSSTRINIPSSRKVFKIAIAGNRVVVETTDTYNSNSQIALYNISTGSTTGYVNTSSFFGERPYVRKGNSLYVGVRFNTAVDQSHVYSIAGGDAMYAPDGHEGKDVYIGSSFTYTDSLNLTATSGAGSEANGTINVKYKANAKFGYLKRYGQKMAHYEISANSSGAIQPATLIADSNDIIGTGENLAIYYNMYFAFDAKIRSIVLFNDTTKTLKTPFV